MFGIKNRQDRKADKIRKRFPLYPFEGIYQEPPIWEEYVQAAHYIRAKLAKVATHAVGWDGTYTYAQGATLPDRRLDLSDQRISRALDRIAWIPTAEEVAIAQALGGVAVDIQ